MRLRIHWPVLAACGLLAAAGLRAVNTNSRSAPMPPPYPPTAQAIRARARLNHLSPVEYFRGLLGMTPAEREKALASRPPNDRKIILAKIQEYEALPRAVREARLCQTELHWELGALMRLPAEQRTNHLREVSPLYRPMLRRLLKEWDEVPVNTQKTLLENQDFIGLYLRLQGGSPAAQKEIIDTLSPERRALWEQEMGRWQALPENERADLCAKFQQFCAMSGQEQEKTVSPLPEIERQMMEKALRSFNHLPPEERTACINSFRKFATMGPAQRAQFLNNAARWDTMTVRERQLWHQLVRRCPPMPPLPPGMPPLPMRFHQGAPLPPLPPSVTAPVVIALSTNDVR